MGNKQWHYLYDIDVDENVDLRQYNVHKLESLGWWFEKLDIWRPVNKNPDWCVESLYQTKKGEYFIDGSGSPQSRYGRYNEETGQKECGYHIIPITPSEAWQWADKHLSTERVAEIFDTGEVKNERP